MSKKRNNRISNGAVKCRQKTGDFINDDYSWILLAEISAPWVDSHIAQQIDPIKVTTARGKQRPFDLTEEKAEWLQEFQGSRECVEHIQLPRRLPEQVLFFSQTGSPGK